MTGRVMVVGLDVSLARTGIARLTVDGTDDSPLTWTGSVSALSGEQGERIDRTWRRLDYLADLVAENVSLDTDLVVIEAPALGASNAGTLALTGAWWLVLDRVLSRTSARVVPVAPGAVKVWATGDGSRATDKAAMVRAARQHYPDAWDVDNHDVADAIHLAALGAYGLGAWPASWVEPVPVRTRNLGRIRWPFPTPHLAPAPSKRAPVKRARKTTPEGPQ